LVQGRGYLGMRKAPTNLQWDVIAEKTELTGMEFTTTTAALILALI